MQPFREKLVTDNIRLVYFMFNKLQKTNLTISYRDDLISEGMLGLVKAANSYDSGRGIKFASYAARCIHNQMLMHIRKLKKHTKAEVPLYQAVNIDEEGNELSYADVIESKEIPQDTMLAMADFNAFFKKQKQRDGKIFQFYCEGYNQKEISEKFGISQSYISRIIKNIRNDFERLSD